MLWYRLEGMVVEEVVVGSNMMDMLGSIVGSKLPDMVLEVVVGFQVDLVALVAQEDLGALVDLVDH